MNDPVAPHLLFITGRLAETALRRVVEPLAVAQGFEYSVQVLPITVAALMTPDWIAKRLEICPGVTQLVLPGYCEGDLSRLIESCEFPITVGPKDLHALPEFFGQDRRHLDDYGPHDIEIIAEINHAPRLSLPSILDQASRLQAGGADIIDLGCQPGENWHEVGDCVRALLDAGHRVSVDSFNVDEIARAARAGAELVLSVNHTNRAAAADWGCEVVAIPDDPTDLKSLDETVSFLERNQVAYRLDPILEPIGFGFADSLVRYAQVRSRYPEAAMMMGIGNLTELTDVDSAGANVLLLAMCQEWSIRSVLTTQVINWCRDSVRECDIARRMIHYAVTHRVLPKHLESRLILLRDEYVHEQGSAQLDELAHSIRDHSYRVFAESGQLHLIASKLHLTDRDPFVLFQKLLATDPTNMDASHAFYLGHELSKALTALTLGKQYHQDESLNWGYLTIPEDHHPPTRRGKTP